MNRFLNPAVAALLLCASLPVAAQTATPRVCKATAAAPTYTEGSFQPLSCELDGDLREGTQAVTQGTSPWVVSQPTGWKAPAAATIDTEFTAQTADFTVEAATANLRLMGWSVREDAGTAAVATVVLRHDADGTCNSTAVAAYIELAANGSQSMSYSDRGLSIASGLCADVLAGSVSLVAHLATEAAP